MSTIQKVAGPKGETLYRARIDAPAGSDGKRRQRQFTASTRREVKDWLDTHTSQVKRNLYIQPSRETLGEWAAKWLEGKRKGGELKATTAQLYDLLLRAYVVPSAIGSTPMQGLESETLKAWLGDLLASGGRRGQGLAPKTVRNIGLMLHVILEDARTATPPKIAVNPLSRKMLPRQVRTRERQRMMVVWKAPQIRAFLEHVRSDRLFALWHLACMTGLRRNELLGLQWPDVDLTTGRIEVGRGVTIVDFQPHVDTPKTDTSIRTIYVDPDTLAALREHRRRQLEERMKWGEGYKDEGWLFARPDGSVIHPERIYDWFQQHSRKAGLPKIRFHDVRHSYATAALEAGIAAKVVSQRLGHSSVAITLDLYSHVLADVDQAAADRVAALILGG